MFSTDGGLTFDDLRLSDLGERREGEAKLLEARVNLAEVTDSRVDASIGAWWKNRSEGFSTARTDDGIDTTEYGAEAIWRPTDDLRLSARTAVVDREDVQKRSTESVQADYRVTGRTELGIEARHESVEPEGGEETEATLVGVRAGYDITADTRIYGTVQTAVDEDEEYEDNDLVSVGVRTPLTEKGDIRVEAVAGDRGEALRVGADYRVRDGHEVYGTVSLSPDRTDTARDAVVVGQRARLSNQLRVFTENQFTQDPGQAGLAHVFGLDFRPNPAWHLGLSMQSSDLDRDEAEDLDRDVISLSAGRLGEAMRWSSKLEFRRDRGDRDTDQWLTTNALDYRANDSWTVLGKVSLSWTEDQRTDYNEARFVEADLGLAFRPVYNDRLNLLSRYTFLYDLPAPGQSPQRTDQRIHVLSTEALYDLTRRWAVGGKLAWKQGEQRAGRDTGDWYETETGLTVVQARYRLVREWDALVEFRRLWVDEAETTRQGVLVGVYRQIRDHMKLGVGYNFTDFDDDLTRLDYENRGWFLNVVGKY
jgi:hypothetical protein